AAGARWALAAPERATCSGVGSSGGNGTRAGRGGGAGRRASSEVAAAPSDDVFAPRRPPPRQPAWTTTHAPTTASISARASAARVAVGLRAVILPCGSKTSVLFR